MLYNSLTLFLFLKIDFLYTIILFWFSYPTSSKTNSHTNIHLFYISLKNKGHLKINNKIIKTNLLEMYKMTIVITE